MVDTRRVLASALTLLFLLSLTATATPLPDGDWIRLEFDNLTVISNLKEKKAAEYARRLLLLNGLLDPFMGPKSADSRRKKLYLFDEREDFVPYIPLYKGEPANLAGYTAPGIDTVYLAVDTSLSYAMEVIYHEFVHARLSESLPHAPLWVHEGLAELYGYLRFENDHVMVGRPIKHHKDLLENIDVRKLFPEARFLLLDTSDPEYNEGLRQGEFYAQSWGSVHYLLLDKEHRTAFGKFLRLLREGEAPMVAFQRVLVDHFPHPRRELREYMSQPRLPHFRFPLKGRMEAEHRKFDLAPAELYVLLGDLLTNSDTSLLASARKHYESALELDPIASGAQLGLATVDLREDDSAAAIARLRTALEANPGDSSVQILLGVLLVDEFIDKITWEHWTRPTETPEPLVEARGLLRAALEREPDNAVALASLGYSYTPDRDPALGVESLRKATLLMPWRREFFEDLLYLYCNSGAAEDARELLEKELKPRMLLGEGKKLEFDVVNVEIARARKHQAEGDITAAAIVLSRAAQHTKQWQARKRIAAAQEGLEVDERLSRLQQIIELYQNEKFEQALAALDELQPTLTEEELLELVVSLRNDIELRLSFR